MSKKYTPSDDSKKFQIDYEITHGKHFLELLSVANEYIRFIDESKELDKHTIMVYLQKILPLIYLKSSLLPEISLDDNSADERFVTEEEYELVLIMLNEKFGQKCDNSHDCHCDEEGPKVAEALADLYQDLKDTILLFSTNKMAAQQWAVSNCRNWFIARWGLAVADILGYIHGCIYHLSDYDETEQKFD